MGHRRSEFRSVQRLHSTHRSHHRPDGLVRVELVRRLVRCRHSNVQLQHCDRSQISHKYWFLWLSTANADVESMFNVISSRQSGMNNTKQADNKWHDKRAHEAVKKICPLLQPCKYEKKHDQLGIWWLRKEKNYASKFSVSERLRHALKMKALQNDKARTIFTTCQL